MSSRFTKFSIGTSLATIIAFIILLSYSPSPQSDILSAFASSPTSTSADVVDNLPTTQIDVIQYSESENIEPTHNIPSKETESDFVPHANEESILDADQHDDANNIDVDQAKSSAHVISTPASVVILGDTVISQPVDNQIVIQFASSASDAERLAYIKSIGGEVVQSVEVLDTVVIHVEDRDATDLPESSLVIANSEPNYYVSAMMNIPPNDPLYDQQWALQAMDILTVWQTIPKDAPIVTVAVIDSGVCFDHPDLVGRILDNGYDFVDDDNVPDDVFGHGCAVTGVIAANVDNNIGIAGVAPNAMVMPLRVLNENGLGTYSDVAKAIVYAVDNGAEIINLSLGGINSSTILENAVHYAANHNVTVVAAAGNTGAPESFYPARYEGVISVGALDEDGSISSFSNRGADQWAPGQQIATISLEGNYLDVTGTSIAASLITGKLVTQNSLTVESITEQPKQFEFVAATGVDEIVVGSELRFPNLLDLLTYWASFFHTSCASLDDCLDGTALRDAYQDITTPIKYLAYISGDTSLPSPLGIGESKIGAKMLFDLADYNGISIEGQPDENGYEWVTVWVALDGSLVGKGIDLNDVNFGVGIGVVAIDFGNLDPDPRFQFAFTGINASACFGTGAELGLVNYSSSGYKAFSADAIICPAEASISAINGSASVGLLEIRKDYLISLLDIASTAMPSNINIYPTQMTDINSIIINEVIEVNSNLEVKIIAPSSKVRWLTTGDDSQQTEVDANITYSWGGIDIDQYGVAGNGVGVADNYYLAKTGPTSNPNDPIPRGKLQIAGYNTGNISSDLYVTLESALPYGWHIRADDGLTNFWNNDRRHDLESVPSGGYFFTNWIVEVDWDAPPYAEVTFSVHDNKQGLDEQLDEVTLTLQKLNSLSDFYNAPIIVHVPQDSIRIGETLRIDATITDNGGVFSADIFYKVPGAETFIKQPLQPQGDNIYRFEIPTQEMEIGSFEYYLTASDYEWLVSHPNNDIHSTLVEPPDNLPYLDNPSISPSHNGVISTPFDFAVRYTDVNNDPPDSVTVFINGTEYSLSSTDNVYTDGSIFELTGEIFPNSGVYSYYFKLVQNSFEYTTQTLNFYVYESGEGHDLGFISYDLSRDTVDLGDPVKIYAQIKNYQNVMENFITIDIEVRKNGAVVTTDQIYPLSIAGGATLSKNSSSNALWAWSANDDGVYEIFATINPSRGDEDWNNNTRSKTVYVGDAEPLIATAYRYQYFFTPSTTTSVPSGCDALAGWSQFAGPVSYSVYKLWFVTSSSKYYVCVEKSGTIVKSFFEDSQDIPIEEGRYADDDNVFFLMDNTYSVRVGIPENNVTIDPRSQNIEVNSTGTYTITLPCGSSCSLYNSPDIYQGSNGQDPPKVFLDLQRNDWSVNRNGATFTVAGDPWDLGDNRAFVFMTERLSTSTNYLVYGRFDSYEIPDNPPSVNINFPTDNSTVSGFIDLKASATDDNGISKIEFYLDSTLLYTDALSPYAYSWNTTDHNDGAYTLRATAYDTANQSNTKSFAIIIDNNPPTIINIAHTPSSPGQEAIEISAIISDVSGLASASVKYKKTTDTSWKSLAMADSSGDTWTATIPVHDATTIEYRVLATDTLGRSVESGNNNITITDKTKPTISTTWQIPADVTEDTHGYVRVFASVLDTGGSGLSGNPQFDYHISSGYTDWITMTHQSGSTYFADIPADDWNAQQGNTLNYKIQATDAAGNERNQEITDYIDPINDPPWVAGYIPDQIADINEPIILDLNQYERDEEDIDTNLTWHVTNAGSIIVQGENSSDDRLTFIPPADIPYSQIITLHLKDSGVPTNTVEETSRQITLEWRTITFCETVSDVSQLECEALEALYASTDGDNWNNNSGWLTDIQVCNWHGVINCSNGHITQLSLYDNNLSGSIPSEIGQLTGLQLLDLGANQLSGSIPLELSQISTLESIYLSENQLNGVIPSVLGQLANLQMLDLSINQLSGNIPTELSQLINLQQLFIEYNQLSGGIPPELGLLSNLTGLALSGNQLSGSIPAELGQLTSLRELGLQSNLLAGNIPPELGQLSNLQSLALSENQLSGSIPSEFSQLANLQHLRIELNQLSGPIPSALGQLSNLQSLVLYNNQLSGSIPPELGQLTSLDDLWLDHNQLSGSIPPELGQLTSLEHLSVRFNQLSDSIPPELGQLTNLIALDIGSNQLIGSIPSEIGQLTSLLELDVRNNQLSGRIPSEIGQLINLRSLFLHNNQLIGEIPAELGQVVSLEALTIFDNHLAGEVPFEITNLSNLIELDISNNCLIATDTNVTTFLNGKNPGWEAIQDKCAVFGYVQDDKNNPLEGIRVQLLHDDGSQHYLDCTDKNGYYIGVVPIETKLRVVAGGHHGSCGNSTIYAFEVWEETVDAENAPRIVVSANNPKLDDTNFTLEEGGILRGTMYGSATGQPIPNLGIDIDFGDIGWGVGMCTDDTPGSEGQFEFTGIPFDTPFKLVAANGNCDTSEPYLHEVYPDQYDWNDGYWITISSDDPILEYDMHLELGGVISGQFFESDGTTPIPSSDIEIVLLDANGNYNWVDSQWLNNASSYRFDAVYPGDYKLFAMPAGYAYQYFGGTLDFDIAQVISVSSGSNHTADFSFDAGGAIEGTVTSSETGLPLENASVKIDNVDDPGVDTCTDENGNYSISFLPLNATYTLRAGDLDACEGPSPGTFLIEWWADKWNQEDADAVTISDADPIQSGIDFVMDKGGSVSGQVVDEDTGQPLGNIDINILFNNGRDGIGTCTSPDGKYLVEGIPYDVRFLVTAEGNENCNNTEPYVEEIWEQAFYWDDATSLMVTPISSTFVNIDFTLVPAGMIRGTLINQDTGQPLRDVNVNFEILNDHWGTGDCTNENGEYVAFNLPRDVDIIIRSGGQDCNGNAIPFGRKYWVDTIDSEQATPVRLTAENAYESVIDFSLEQGGSISGQITDSITGQPIGDVEVMAELPDTYGNWIANAYTHLDGTYTIIGLPSGDYRVRTKPRDHIAEFYDDHNYLLTPRSEANLVQVVKGQNTPGINFELSEGGNISGTVRNENGDPLQDAHVIVETFEWQWVGDSWTNDDGNYSIGGLSDGNYRVKAYANGYALSIYDNHRAYPFNFNDATPVGVSEGATTSGIDFNLPEGGTVEVAVYDENGILLDGIPVDTVPGGFGRCTENGTAYLENLPLNTDIIVQAGGSQWGGCSNLKRVQQYYDDTYDFHEATPVVMTLPAQMKNISFTLSVAGTVSGKVMDDATLQGIGNLNIRIEPIDNPDMLSVDIANTCTNSDGTFTFDNLPLNLTYRIIAPYGPFNWCQGGIHPGYIQEYYQDVYTDEDATPISLTDVSNPITSLEIYLDVGGKVAGVVTDQITGDPLENIPVRLNGDQHGDFTCTLPDGSYVFEHVPYNTLLRVWAASNDGSNECNGPLNYVEEYWEEGFYSQTDFVTVTQTSPIISNIDFTLEQGIIVTGQVVDELTGDPLGNINIGAHFERTGIGVCTDPTTGTYQIVAPPNRDVMIVAAPGSNWCGGSNEYIPEYWEDVYHEPSATLFNSPGGTTYPGINFDLDYGAYITGQVTADEDGSPLAGVTICAIDYAGTAYNDSYSASCATTDQNGEYLLDGIPTGQNRVWTSPEGRLNLFYPQSTTFDDAQPVVTTVGQTTGNIDFSLPLGAAITGLVTAEDGVTPMGNVEVSTADGEYTTCSGRDGTYSMYVLPGTYIVKAGAGFCNTLVEFPTQFYDEVFASELATPVTLNTINDTVTDIDFTWDSPILDVPVLSSPVCDSLTDEDQPTFKWQSVAQATMYDIQLDTLNPPEATFNVTTSQFKPPSALLPVTYYWRVQAGNSAGKRSDWSPICILEITSTTHAVPSQNYVTTDTPTLTWNDVTDATAYEIAVGVSPSFTEPLSFSATVQADTLYVVPTALDNGTYYWRVRAKNGTNIGSWSIVQTFIVNAP